MRYEREVLPISKLPDDIGLGDEIMLLDTGQQEPSWRLCVATENGFFVGSKADLQDYVRQLSATGEGYAEWMEMPTHWTMPAPLPLPVSKTNRRQ